MTASPPSLGRSVARLTLAKTVSNTALRWVAPFLPTLERAFGTTTTQMTTILGIGEMAGLSTIATRNHMRLGRERIVLACGLLAVAVASLVALVGTAFTFAVGMVLVVAGVAHVTVSGHTFIGNRVPYDRRARSLGLFETSWALSLLVGAPLIAGLIALFGWRGPYVVLAIAAALVAGVVLDAARRSGELARRPRATDVEPTAGAHAESTTSARPSGPIVWLVVAASSFIAMAGLSVFAISGSWLDDAFGVSTGGLGVIAMGFGGVELISSLTSATFADRWGKRRSTMVGCAVVVAGCGLMSVADDTLWVGVVGLLVFLTGFEFAIVTSFSLVTEAAPEARGHLIAISSGVGTFARGFGTIVGGWLYGRYGVEATLTLSGTAAVLTLGCLGALPRAGSSMA